jgi:hypothetical protein
MIAGKVIAGCVHIMTYQYFAFSAAATARSNTPLVGLPRYTVYQVINYMSYEESEL